MSPTPVYRYHWRKRAVFRHRASFPARAVGETWLQKATAIFGTDRGWLGVPYGLARDPE